jgi:Flp pilus assembly CpaF family ATPase
MASNAGARGLADLQTRCTPIVRSTRLDALYRLEGLLRAGQALPLRSMIVRFVDLVVYTYMGEDGHRSIGDIQRVMGVDAGSDCILESAA